MMNALLLTACSLFAADSALYTYEEHGEVELRVPVEGPYEGFVGVEEKYVGVVVRYDKGLGLQGFEDRSGYPLAAYGKEWHAVAGDLPPSKRIKEPVITRTAKDVRVRFPSQWLVALGDDDVDITIKGDVASMTRTTVTKKTTVLEVK
jgi:hypothetical protein